MKEHKKDWNPIYFISKALLSTKTRYSHLEKAILALVTTIRKLRLYFEAYTIHMITNHPLRSGLFQQNITGRMIKWVVELGNFGIKFAHRKVIKGQVLANFTAEFVSLESERVVMPE